jgi:hypothetical protein
MGLDMYAFTVDAKDAGDNVVDLKRYDENDVHETISSTKLFYWLEMDTGNNKLVPIKGFFFGEQTLYPEDIESVADFIAKAREALADGKAVYYDSWW